MPSPYPNFQKDLELAKTLKTELDSDIQKAKETGQTAAAETLVQKTQAHLDSMEVRLWPFESELSRQELQEQYIIQKEILAKNNLLEPLRSGELGITGIDQKAYPFPKLEEIQKELQKDKELKLKMEQGFIQIQITPFALPLSKLTETVSKSILKHKQEGKLFTAKKDPNDPAEQLIPLELDENQPLWVWDQYQNADTNNNLAYFPQQYDPANHQGQTKQQVLNIQTKFPGYLVTLQEKNVNISQENQGQTKGGRKQIEANLTPAEYLQKLQADPQYQKESGLTPEEWLTKFLTHLEKTDQVIDDYQGHGSFNYNLAGYFPNSGFVSGGYWDRDHRQAGLSRYGARLRFAVDGARSGVRVGLGI